MKRLGIPLFIFLLAMTFSSQAEADLVYRGTIYWRGGNPVDEPSGLDVTTQTLLTTITTVDHIFFTVERDGMVEIDLLSAEISKGVNTDVNGDGEIAFIDPTIYLFRATGVLDESDLVAFNDDDLDKKGGEDGSISVLDPYWSGFLGAGRYVLAVGDYELSLAAAIAGVNENSIGPYGPLMGLEWPVSDHGDYQVTIRGEVTIQPVPEPATLLLLVSGLTGFLGLRRGIRTKRGPHPSRQNL